MSRRARHKAPKKCCDHVDQLEVAQADIHLLSDLIEKINADRDSLVRQVRALRAELTGQTETETLSRAQIRAHMRRTAPDVVPVSTVEGRTMLVPVGRSDKARPAWPDSIWASG
jgi:hypothetical protein